MRFVTNNYIQRTAEVFVCCGGELADTNSVYLFKLHIAAFKAALVNR